MEKWVPIDLGNVANARYNLDSILFSEDKLTIKLFNNSQLSSIKVIFDYIDKAYRVSEERYRTALFGRLETIDYANKTFFRVEESDYMKWCSKESGTLSDYENATHYAFITDDYVIDVIAGEAPEVIVEQ